MAPKNKGESSGRLNRFRMVIIDSDLSDDAVGNLTQAITHALRGGTLPAAKPAQRSLASGNGKAETVDVETEELDTETTEPVDEPASAPRTTTPKTPRQYTKPKVLNVELVNGRAVPFDVFAKEKGPTADTKRYLMVAAWYHDYAETPSVTADHVYTCYRAMGWTLEVPNPNQPFADLQRSGWGAYKNKTFQINHIGISQVQKMNAGE